MVDHTDIARQAIDALRRHQLEGVPSPLLEHILPKISSSLGLNETVILEAVGYEPVAIVTGSSVFEIPEAGRWVNYRANSEIDVFSHGLHHARIASLKRIRQAAVECQADGVIDIQFDLPGIPKKGNEIRFTATGLAVRSNISAQVQPRADCKTNPFTTSMVGRDFSLLIKAGYLSVGLVMGVCVYHVGRRTVSDTVKELPDNSELRVITDALYDSRERAMSRMQSEAKALDSDGVIGCHISEATHAWGSRVIEFLAIGTAVELVADSFHPLKPKLVTPLSN